MLALLLHSTIALSPNLLRVRGGGPPPLCLTWPQRLSAVTSSLAAGDDAVQEPALLDDALHGGRTVGDATPPNALQVFSRVLGFVWSPDAKLRILVLASLAALVLSKCLNVMVPFTLKRAVDALEKSGASGALAVHTTPLLLTYVGARLGVSLSNELRTVAFTRVSQSAQRAFASTLFAKLHALDAAFHASNPTGLLAVAFSRGVGGFRSLLFQLLFSVLPVALELGPLRISHPTRNLHMYIHMHMYMYMYMYMYMCMCMCLGDRFPISTSIHHLLMCRYCPSRLSSACPPPSSPSASRPRSRR